MRRILRVGFSVVLVALAAGCTDRLPTLSGEGPFPIGGRGTTLEHILEADQFLLGSDVYSGATGIEDADGMLVAREFDGDLNAHVLATFGAFPDTVIVDGEIYEEISFLDAEVVAAIPDTLTASQTSLTFQLWTITQAWDTAAVSWENADETPGSTTPWVEPGGTRGELIATTTWLRADTAAIGDSLSWTVPANVVSRLARDELPGLMVTLEDENARVSISDLSMRTDILPAADLDTVVVRTIPQGPQTFIFTPEAPAPTDVLRVGGLRSDRTVLRLRVPSTLPGCSAAESCSPVSASDVSLDRIDLILDPAPVASGFRPVSPLEMVLRRVHELELGERATLGQPVAFDTISAARFIQGDAAPVQFLLTGAFMDAIDQEQDEIGIALLVEPEASSFGYAWFERNPRLRFVYTLPETLELP